jgi:hypothetical protein
MLEIVPKASPEILTKHMDSYLAEYYRYPENSVRIAQKGNPSAAKGFFRFGKDLICYGRCEGVVSNSPKGVLFDALKKTFVEAGTTFLPFDLAEVVDNLRYELYTEDIPGGSFSNPALAKIYYFLRPILPIEVRKHLQKAGLNGWRDLRFPHWPVDRTVDTLFEKVLTQTISSCETHEIPFIWFWPDGASSCAIMTHDVETASGRDACSSLMDINDSFKIRASFQIVPEKRYEVSESFLSSIRDRGFEINVQDLNHDGQLFRSQREFLERAAKIDLYRKQFGAEGFRAAVLYRNQQWYDALKFSYDMSIPNVAHLDPQRGGCCTVMPYFIGDILELPVTTTQDYSLFHILNDYSIDLWKQQTGLIMEKHGLMSFIIHPDYSTGAREQSVYKELLTYLSTLRNEKNVWIPTSSEVNRWWRQRREMKLVTQDDRWRIEGEGSERARIAYASEHDGQLVYSLTPQSQRQNMEELKNSF